MKRILILLNVFLVLIIGGEVLFLFSNSLKEKALVKTNITQKIIPFPTPHPVFTDEIIRILRETKIKDDQKVYLLIEREGIIGSITETGELSRFRNCLAIKMVDENKNKIRTIIVPKSEKNDYNITLTKIVNGKKVKGDYRELKINQKIKQVQKYDFRNKLSPAGSDIFYYE